MMRRKPSVFAFISCLALCACASGPQFAERSVDERIESALDQGASDCGRAAATQTLTFRELFGLPVCEEQYRTDAFRQELRAAPTLALAFNGEPMGCAASLRDVGGKKFDAALTRVMTARGFLEQTVLYVTFCSRAECNGESYCSALSRRQFFHPDQMLEVMAYFGGRNYPRVQTISVMRAADNHLCTKPETAANCFPPGAPPR